MEADAGGWENIRIETYLEAAAAWAKSTDFGVSQGLNENNFWRRFAPFLSVGKSYLLLHEIPKHMFS